MSEFNDVPPPPPPPPLEKNDVEAEVKVQEQVSDIAAVKDQIADNLEKFNNHPLEKHDEPTAKSENDGVVDLDDVDNILDQSDQSESLNKVEDIAAAKEKKEIIEKAVLAKDEQAKFEKETALEELSDEKERQRELDETLAEECRLVLGREPDSHTLRFYEGAKKAVQEAFGLVSDQPKDAEIRNPDIPWQHLGESTLLAAALVAAMFGKHFGETVEKLKQSESFQSLLNRLNDQRGNRL